MNPDNDSTPEELEDPKPKKPTKIAKTDGGGSGGDNNADDSPPEGCMVKFKRMTNNCFQSCGLCCFKFKENSFISKYEFQITQRQKKFGVDYLELVHRKASQQALKQCLKLAMKDIAVFQKEIDEHDDKIDKKEDDVNREIKPSPSASAGGSASVPPPKKKKPTKQKAEQHEEPSQNEEPSEGQDEDVPKTKKKPAKKKQGQGQSSGEAAADSNLKPPSGDLEEIEMEETKPRPKPKKKKSKKPLSKKPLEPVDDEWGKTRKVMDKCTGTVAPYMMYYICVVFTCRYLQWSIELHTKVHMPLGQNQCLCQNRLVLVDHKSGICVSVTRLSNNSMRIVVSASDDWLHLYCRCNARNFLVIFVRVTADCIDLTARWQEQD